MKAAQLQQFGHPGVIEIGDVEKPKPQKGQVLVKVHASSVNPFDVKLSEGMMPDLKLPMVLGGDIAGVVAEVGEGVEHVVAGNKVYGSANVLAGATGAFAEFAVTPVGMIARLPNNLDFNQAAASVLTGVSAVQALLEHFVLQSDQKILIHGGSGGIGTMAIQIAKSIGAHVATTATGEGISYVKKLGADEVIDYKSQKFEELLKDYDAVFDTVGGEVFEKSFKVLKKGGKLVSMVAKDEKNLAGQHEVSVVTQFTKITKERLDQLTGFLEKGKVKVRIDKIYHLDKINDAFLEKREGEVFGKLVIQINS